MLKALEALGLVERFRVEDRRYNAVCITEKGEAVFRAARDLLMRSVQRVVITAVCFGRPRDRAEREAHRRRVTSYLTALRVYLGDTARLEQDWTQPTPWEREWGPPAMLLRDWAPPAA